jgi:hypothetical protein
MQDGNLTVKQLKNEGIVCKGAAMWLTHDAPLNPKAKTGPSGRLFLTKQRVAFQQQPRFVFPLIGGLIGLLLFRYLSKFVQDIPLGSIQEVKVDDHKVGFGMRAHVLNVALKDQGVASFTLTGNLPAWQQAFASVGVPVSAQPEN